MKNPSTQKTVLFLSTIALVLAGAYTYGIVYVNEGCACIDVARKHLTEMEKKATEVDAIEKALDEFRIYQDAVDSHIIGKEGIVQFVETVEDAAHDAGVSIRIDQLEEVDVTPKALTELKRLNATFTVRGTWRQVMIFAALVDSLPHQVFVRAANITTDKSGEDKKAVEWVGTWSVAATKFK